MGNLHELAGARKSQGVRGVTLGSGGLADIPPTLLKNRVTWCNEIIYDTDPERSKPSHSDARQKYADLKSAENVCHLGDRYGNNTINRAG